MAEILWNVGEKTKAIVTLPGEIPHISHSHVYFQDSVTEKLYLFEIENLEELQIFIKRFLFYVSIVIINQLNIQCIFNLSLLRVQELFYCSTVLF